MSDRQILTVSQLNTMIRLTLENFTVWVEAEVDEYQDGYKSAVYLKLKDGESVLPAMFWKFTDVGYLPKSGEKILAFGTLTLYEKTGKYQIMLSKIEPFGEGELLKKREELRKKLQAEGYFDESKKRPIPTLPLKIGLVTSKRGAAIEDFLKNVVKSYEGLEIYFVDTQVQGDPAIKSIVASLERLYELDLDLVVVTRGGGDIEDLMCFNTEEVVKAIRACPHPVISAVGHEVDYTLCDLASDLRVSTPTKAAEYIADKYTDFKNALNNEMSLSDQKMQRIMQKYMQDIDLYESSFKRVWNNFKNMPETLDMLLNNLSLGIIKQITTKETQLNASLIKLNALNPDKVLQRGYSIAYTEKGHILNSTKQVSNGDILTLKVYDGIITSKVIKD